MNSVNSVNHPREVAANIRESTLQDPPIVLQELEWSTAHHGFLKAAAAVHVTSEDAWQRLARMLKPEADRTTQSSKTFALERSGVERSSKDGADCGSGGTGLKV